MAWRGETEDGLGWGGLVPTKAEREQEKREQRTARRLAAAQRMADAVQAFLEGRDTGARTLPSTLHDWKEASR